MGMQVFFFVNESMNKRFKKYSFRSQSSIISLEQDAEPLTDEVFDWVWMDEELSNPSNGGIWYNCIGLLSPKIDSKFCWIDFIYLRVQNLCPFFTYTFLFLPLYTTSCQSIENLCLSVSGYLSHDSITFCPSAKCSSVVNDLFVIWPRFQEP